MMTLGYRCVGRHRLVVLVLILILILLTEGAGQAARRIEIIAALVDVVLLIGLVVLSRR